MPRNRHTVEQIMTTLRQAEVALRNGQPVVQVCWPLGITEHIYYRSGMSTAVARSIKRNGSRNSERENTRLTRAVANLTLDKLILKEATEGSF